MLGIALLVIIATSSVWVYWDASTKGIGSDDDARRRFPYSAMDWALATLFLWPFGFPFYLRMRSELSTKIANRKIGVKERSLKLSAIALSAVGYLTLSIGFPVESMDENVPRCDDSSAISKLQRMIGDTLNEISENAEVVSITNNHETANTTDSGIRSCRGSLVTTAGEIEFKYEVGSRTTLENEPYINALLIEY